MKKLFFFILIVCAAYLTNPSNAYCQQFNTELNTGFALATSHVTNGSTTFGSISFNYGSFSEPTVSDISITSSGTLPLWVPNLNWLDKTIPSTDPATHDLVIGLVVKNMATIPIPTNPFSCSGPTNCPTEAACARRKACFGITVTVSQPGVVTSRDFFICIYEGSLSIYSSTSAVEMSSLVSAPIVLSKASGVTISPRFTSNQFSNGGSCSVTWALSPAAPGVGISIVVTTNGSGEQDVVLTSGASTPPNTYNFNLIATKDGTSQSISIQLTVTGDQGLAAPVDIFFVVDVSGSMNSPAVCRESSPGLKKLDIVKQKINDAFLAVFGTSPVAGSRAGIVQFASNLPTQTKEVLGLTAVTGNFATDFFIPKINDLAPLGSTAMGEGLILALNALKAVGGTNRKIVIVLTNGMQNDGRLLTTGSDGMPYIGTVNVVATYPGIKILPIAIYQPDDNYKKDLRNLSLKTDARESVGVGLRVGDVCELDFDLKQFTTDALKTNSPKIIAHKSGVLSGNSASYEFTLNENFDQLVLSGSVIGNSNITYKVEKSINNTWVDISGGGRYLPNENAPSPYREFEVFLPKSINGNNITPTGKYRMQINNTQANLPYNASVLVDNKGLRNDHFTGDITYRAGDKMFLSSRLTFPAQAGGVGDAQVIATINYPKVSGFGEAFAKKNIPKSLLETVIAKREDIIKNLGIGITNTLQNFKFQKNIFVKNITMKPPQNQSFEANQTIADQKLQILLSETNFWKKIEYQNKSIPLNHVGNGIYAGEFSETAMAADYKIGFEVRGHNAAYGDYLRLDSKTVPVLIGAPDLSASKLFMLSEKPYYISLCPKDKYGNLLGPGQAKAIKTILSIGTAGEPIDYLDGRYVIPLFVTAKTDPVVEISLPSGVLFQGQLSKIKRKLSYFVIQGGYTLPREKFDLNHNSGFSIESKLGFKISGGLGINLEGGYYSFTNQLSASKKQYTIAGGALGPFLWLPFAANGWDVQLGINGGYYKPSDQNARFGANGRLTLSRYFSPSFSIALDGGYFRIFTKPEKTDFISTSLGFRFHF